MDDVERTIARRDLEQLEALRSRIPATKTENGIIHLGARTNSPEGATYRKALDQTLKKYGGLEGFRVALGHAQPAEPSPVETPQPEPEPPSFPLPRQRPDRDASPVPPVDFPPPRRRPAFQDEPRQPQPAAPEPEPRFVAWVPPAAAATVADRPDVPRPTLAEVQARELRDPRMRGNLDPGDVPDHQRTLPDVRSPAAVLPPAAKSRAPAIDDWSGNWTVRGAPSFLMPHDQPSPAAPAAPQAPHRTHLSPDLEARFQAWYADIASRAGIDPNPDDPRHQYDYRGAFAAGVIPRPDPYDNNRLHWPSQFKDPDHPTMWKETFMQETGQNPDELGLRTPEEAKAWIGGGESPVDVRSPRESAPGAKPHQFPSQVVDVEGVGPVEFPAGMTDDMIAKAIEEELGPSLGRSMAVAVPRGFVESVGSEIKGAGAIAYPTGYHQDLADLDRIEAAQKEGRINEVQHLLDTTNVGRTLGMQNFHANPEWAVAETRRFLTETPAAMGLDKPLKETPLVRAGQAVEDWSKEAFPISPQHETRFPVEVARAVGSTGAFVASRMIPGIGQVMLPVTAMAMGAGQVVDDAEKSGAPDDVAARAAFLGILPGSTDVLPIENLLKPLARKPGAAGLVFAILRKAAEQAFIEGGQEGLQQFLQNTISRAYDAERNLGKDVFDNFTVGAAVGVLFGAAAGPLTARETRQQPKETGAPVRQAAPEAARQQPQEAPQRTFRDLMADPRTVEEIQAEDERNAKTAAETERQRIVTSNGIPAMGSRVTVAADGAEPIQGRLEDVFEVDGVPGVRVVRDNGEAVETFLDESRVTLAEGEGTPESPVKARTAADVDAAAARADTEPTPAQKEAGNYRKGHVDWKGIDISIENPRGSTRSGVGPDGKPWSVKMRAHYGYIKRSEGKDGDGVDVYLGIDNNSDRVFVIDQIDPKTGRFDEHKAILGATNQPDALFLYDSHFDDGSGPARRGAVTAMTVDGFKEWLAKGDTAKPLAYVKPKTEPEPAAAAPEPVPSVEPPSGEPPAVQPPPAAPPGAATLPAVPGTGEGLFVELGSKRYQVESFEDASRRFLRVADSVGSGATDTPTPLITDAAGNIIGHISYNGRVFPGRPGEWKPGTPPLYDSRLPGATLDQTSPARSKGPVVEAAPTAPSAELAGDFETALRRTKFAAENAAKAPDGRAYRIKRDGDGYIAMRMPNERGVPPTHFRPESGRWTEDQAIAHVMREIGKDDAEETKPKPPAEHPGFVIKSLETGRVTEEQPSGTVKPATPKPTDTESPEAFREALQKHGVARDGAGTIFYIRKSRDGRTWGVMTSREGEAGAFFKGPAGVGGVWSREEAVAKAARDAQFIEPEATAPTQKEEGGHFAAGHKAFQEGLPRQLPSYFTGPGKNSRDWLRGWDAASREQPASVTKPQESATITGEEKPHGVQRSVPGGHAPEGAPDVQRTPEVREAGGTRPRQSVGSAPDGTGSSQGQAQASERSREGPGGPEAGRGNRADETDRVPAGEPARRTAERPDARVRGENFRITDLKEGRSWRQKAQDNIRAIELMRQIEAEGRPATQAEQEQLSLYVGWGGIKGAFPNTQGNFEKGFEEIGRKLKDLLPDTEYATARRSIQYAHYTSATIVNAMWKAAQHMGFKGGKVFEPGMGVGNFAGLMPADLAEATNYNGLELDHTTARIARLLYPKWGVRQDDFTKAPLPKDTYDLVIGNPPFADIPIKSDPEYAKHSFLLHDYFFAKSLDAVRPGGLLMFISSAGTMNKIDPKAREYLAERADLVGAVRLPGDAFEKNAGTSVTTDIIMLRKKDPATPFDVVDGAALREHWVETVEVTLRDKEGSPAKGRVNRWFVENPGLVLGEEGFFDKLYQGRYAVRSDGRDLGKALAETMNRLPADIISEPQTIGERAEVDFGTSERKDGSFYQGQDGSLMQVRNGVGRPVATRGKGVEGGLTAASIERIKGLVPVRDALRAVYDADLKGDAGNAKAARARLNESYDAFVKRFGPINKAEISYRRPNVIQQESARAEAREEARFSGNPFDEGSFDPAPLIERGASLAEIARERRKAKEEAEKAGREWNEGTFDPEEMPDVVIDKRPNVDPFMDDPESYRLRAIERYSEDTGEGQKTAVFYENVITREKIPEINSVGDALLFVLNKRGRVDLAEIASVAKITESEALDQLGTSIFRVPGTEDTWQTREQYLSGNVRQKLRQAKAAAERDPELRRNVDALEAVQPAPLPPSEISTNLGMPWIPTDVIEAFGRDLGLDDIKVRYSSVLAHWSVSGDDRSAAATATWGTSARAAPYLIADALNHTDPKIYDRVRDPDGKWKDVLNVEATQAAQDKARAIKDRFADWIWRDAKRTDDLVRLYNEEYNNLVVPEYDGSYLTTPGISTAWSWRPHQKRVIARIIQAGNTYLAHAVGGGKTSEMIGAAMEMRRLGLVRKPMFTVPNHMLGQFTKEFYEQYPTARIAVADERRFHTGRRKQFIADVANDDLDAIIITHSAFGMIPMSDTFVDGLIQEQIEQYRDILSEIDRDDPEQRITRRRLENTIEKLEQRLSGRVGRRRDQVYTFEEMGVDFLFVDEAHLFRKLDFATKMSNVKGISPKGSMASFDLYTKTRYLETINPGRNLALASGTPVTNTMAELFTVSRYLQPRELAVRGLSHFDAWAGAFGDTVTQLEQDASGGYKPVTRFARFVNVPELSAMVRQVMDVVTSSQLSKYVTRPKLKGGKRVMNLAEKSGALDAYQRELARRMELIAQRRGPPKQGDDIVLSVINDGRHAAIDMRLVDSNLPSDPGSKLNLLVDNVYRIWKETKRQAFHTATLDGYDAKPADHGPATQMVFSNLGVGTSRPFSVHRYIVTELTRRGVPKNDIALISNYKSHVAKQRLFNDMNEGKVRIMIGSTSKMATGVNAQRRLYAIHNLDPLWYPADDEQRNGRGIRQGNMNPEIELHDYSTKGTYDSTMWGLMETKARFIQGFFEGDPSIRDMEDLGEASQYEQAKAITTADPRLIELTDLKQQLEKARRRRAAFEREQYAIRDRIASAKAVIDRADERIPQLQKDIARRQDISGDKFKASVGSRTFTERVEFGDALHGVMTELREAQKARKHVKVGEVGGFAIMADVTHETWRDGKPWAVGLYVAQEGDYGTDIKATTSAKGRVQSIENVLRGFEGEVKFQQERKAEAEKTVADYTPQLGKTFTGQAEIDDLAAKVRGLEAQLAAEAAPPPVQETGDEEDGEEGHSRPRYAIRRRESISTGPDGRTDLFEADMEKWGGYVDRLLSGHQAIDRAQPLGRRFHVLEAMGLPGRNIVMPPEIANSVRRKHSDIPRAVWKRLPELVADPLYIHSRPDGTVSVVTTAKTAKGEPIIVGLRGNEIRTVTPRHDIDGDRGMDRELRIISRAVQQPGRVYVRDQEAASRVSGLSRSAPVQSRPASGGGVTTPQGAGGPRRSSDEMAGGGRHPSAASVKAKILSRDDVIKSQGRVFYALSSDTSRRLQAVAADLGARLEKVGIAAKVGLRLAEGIDAVAGDGSKAALEGVYHGRLKLIEVSLEGKDQGWALDHEIVHALRDLGLFTPAEWSVLERSAKADAERTADVGKRYGRHGLAADELVEETVADMFADWSAGRIQTGGPLLRVFNRIKRFFEALANALRGHGFQTAEDVFGRVDSGEVGNRETAGGEENAKTRYAFMTEQEARDMARDQEAHTGKGWLVYKNSAGHWIAATALHPVPFVGEEAQPAQPKGYPGTSYREAWERLQAAQAAKRFAEPMDEQKYEAEARDLLGKDADAKALRRKGRREVRSIMAAMDEDKAKFSIAPDGLGANGRLVIEERADANDLNPFKRYFYTPQAAFKRWPALASLQRFGVRTEVQMSKYVRRLNQRYDAIRGRLSSEQFGALSDLLFAGDAEQREFTDADLAGTDPDVAKAYHDIRDLFDTVGRLVDQHRRAMMPQLRRRKLALLRQMSRLRNMTDPEFRRLYTLRSRLRSRLRHGEGNPEALARQIAAVEADLQIKREAMDEYADMVREVDTIDAALAQTSVRRLAGYVPHKFFGTWAIYKVEEGEDGEPRHILVAGDDGFYPDRRSAIKAAGQMLEDGADVNLVVRPVQFQFPDSQATTLTDASYWRFMKRVGDEMEIEGQELRDLVKGVARRPFRRRVAGFAQFRQGVAGYSQDFDRVMRSHLGEAVRYVMLDKLKYEAIGTMERMGLSPHRSSSGNETLRSAVLSWFRDVNGQKQGVESQIDELLDKPWATPVRMALASGTAVGATTMFGIASNPLVAVLAGSYVGYRVYRALHDGGSFKSRALTGAMLGDMAHLKLGSFFNVFSPVVNLTQTAINTVPVLGTYTMTGINLLNQAVASRLKGKPDRYWRLLERADIVSSFKYTEQGTAQFRRESKLAHASLFLFGKAEQFNRSVSFLGGYQKAIDAGMSEAEAFRRGEAAMVQTQFHYGNAAKPEVLRNVFARVPLQFKNFMAQEIAFIAGLDRKRLPVFLLSLFLVAGGLGLPGLDLIDALLEWWADFSPITEIKRLALKAQAEGKAWGSAANLITRGLPGLIGEDMSARAGVGDKFLPLQATDFQGPWVSTLRSAVRLGELNATVADHLRNLSTGLGRPLKSLEAAANGLPIQDMVLRPKVFFEALADGKIAYTNPWKGGALEYDERILSNADLARMAIGGTPRHVAQLRDVEAIQQHDEAKSRVRTQKYLGRIVDAYRRYGDAGSRDRLSTELAGVADDARKAGVTLSHRQVGDALKKAFEPRVFRTVERTRRQLRPEVWGLAREAVPATSSRNNGS